jgi:hypothetical protein
MMHIFGSNIKFTGDVWAFNNNGLLFVDVIISFADYQFPCLTIDNESISVHSKAKVRLGYCNPYTTKYFLVTIRATLGGAIAAKGHVATWQICVFYFVFLAKFARVFHDIDVGANLL